MSEEHDDENLEVTPGDRNIFRDFGFDEAEAAGLERKCIAFTKVEIAFRKLAHLVDPQLEARQRRLNRDPKRWQRTLISDKSLRFLVKTFGIKRETAKDIMQGRMSKVDEITIQALKRRLKMR